MISYAIFEPISGVIVRSGKAPADMVQMQGGNEHSVCVNTSDSAMHPNSHYVLDGEITEYTKEELHAKDNLPKGFIWKMPERIAFDPRTDVVREQDNAVAVLDSRSISYPPLTDLADALYWQSKGKPEKMDAYLAACEAVKLQYPK